MKSFLQINIEKIKTECVFFLHGNEQTVPEIIDSLRLHQPELVHVITRENERVLVECYISFSNEELFTRRLLAASKAKI